MNNEEIKAIPAVAQKAEVDNPPLQPQQIRSNLIKQIRGKPSVFYLSKPP